MRIVKQRLMEMLPDVKAFLDVDDLVEGKGAEYVDVSALSLVFCSAGYFESPNCMREILRAHVTGKPIVALLELEEKHGGLTHEQIMARLQAADAPCEKAGVQYASKYAMWGLEEEVQSWGYAMPSAIELYAPLVLDPIEWARIGAFQDVSMRLIADRLLPADKQGSRAATYIKGELIQQKVALSPPATPGGFHIYCSPSNARAREMMEELAAQQGLVVDLRPHGRVDSGKGSAYHVTERIEDLALCDYMLIYLHGRTWTSGDASRTFAAQVQQAMDLSVSLLLVHEMPGMGGQEARHACEFGDFFRDPPDGTPSELLRRGIYSSIATPMKGGEWRATSLVMLAQKFSASVVTPQEASARASSSSRLRVPSVRRARGNSRARASMEGLGRFAFWRREDLRKTSTSKTSTSLSTVTVETSSEPQEAEAPSSASQQAMTTPSLEPGANAEGSVDEEGQPSNPIFATQSNWLVHQLGALESSSTSDLCYPSVDATSEASGPRVRPVADAGATADDGNQREALRRSRKLHV